ncbi:hypothetical protein NSZ01_06320 [Nocardioides szechwanensis]|uniref:Membrane protein YfhO n=1 Tax=Nocardioides szechwanensis TaxID=1005944 RepID=A0A1G9VQ05_9ACTN|nr:hypothetical protein [Nocardioides szechwanensis]GEP32864.1 hypothetical protein NSZ01_06320 [Nocardioides szechwanensis]SDM74302.1 hypothetical protein SAMN05192576_0830 [Nocardioides szechwanensis]
MSKRPASAVGLSGAPCAAPRGSDGAGCDGIRFAHDHGDASTSLVTPVKLVVARVWPWVLSLLVLLPLLRPGYVLTYDMVFVPDLAFRSDFLGLGSGLPRAVPSDAVVSLVDEVLPGQVLQKLLLVLALGLAGMGARRLVPADNLTAQLAATSFYVWNPFVAERLGIGHWPLLLTYACLPWLVDSARRARAGERTLPAMMLWLALASLSAAGGVIATALALLCVVGRDREAVRRSIWVVAGAVAVNAPWLVAGVWKGGAALSDPAGVEVFAARGEGVLGLPLTLLGLGGIWNAEVVPASRTAAPAVLMLLVTVVVAIAGLRRWRGTVERRDRHALAAAAVVGLLVALSGSLAPDAMAWVASTVPGGGLFRDGSRFVALLAPLEACLFGLGAAAIIEKVRVRPARLVLATSVVLVPLALLPDLGLGLAGRLHSVSFPAEYAEARTAIEERSGGSEGDLLLLPFRSYRLPTWNEGRRSLDPLGRFMTPNYLADDTLVVSKVAVPGEDERARRVAADLARDLPASELVDRLGDEGIRWVLLDKETAAMLAQPGPEAGLRTLRVVHEGSRLVVWELPRSDPPEPGSAEELTLWAAWTVAGASVLGCLALVAVRRTRRRPEKPRLL